MIEENETILTKDDYIAGLETFCNQAMEFLLDIGAAGIEFTGDYKKRFDELIRATPVHCEITEIPLPWHDDYEDFAASVLKE